MNEFGRCLAFIAGVTRAALCSRELEDNDYRQSLVSLVQDTLYNMQHVIDASRREMEDE